MELINDVIKHTTIGVSYIFSSIITREIHIKNKFLCGLINTFVLYKSYKLFRFIYSDKDPDNYPKNNQNVNKNVNKNDTEYYQNILDNYQSELKLDNPWVS